MRSSQLPLVAHIAVAWLALGVVLQARPCYAVSSLCTCGGTPTAVQIDVWIDQVMIRSIGATTA